MGDQNVSIGPVSWGADSETEICVWMLYWGVFSVPHQENSVGSRLRQRESKEAVL